MYCRSGAHLRTFSFVALPRLYLSISAATMSLYTSIRPHHVLGLYLTVRTAVRFLATPLTDWLGNRAESFLGLVEAGWIPDCLIRFGIRIQLQQRLNSLEASSVEDEQAQHEAILTTLRAAPVAIHTDEANDQHYEVPAAFYDECLGPCKKYSSGLWLKNNIKDADAQFYQSEIDMLALYCQRAQVQDGMSIVDLGCGWGSLTLYLAEHYPNAKITSISNSASQREYIYAVAKKKGFSNITVVTVSSHHAWFDFF